MFAIGVVLIVGGYALLYTGGLKVLALAHGGTLPNTDGEPPPTLLQALGFGDIGPALGRKLKPDTAPAGGPTSGLQPDLGPPAGPVTININGRPVTVTPVQLPSIPVGAEQRAPTAGMTPARAL